MRILFISWDGSQTNYIDGLFIPIFAEIIKKKKISFHIIQFTWANEERIKATKKTAMGYGIEYNALPIYRKPIASIGAIITIAKNIKFIKKYVKINDINIVMPRSTMPALMVNRMKLKKQKILFDADGLPLEERLDFTNLSKTSIQYRFLKNEELKLLKNADGVITRSSLSIAYHISEIGLEYRDKFSVVYNGRDINSFSPNIEKREIFRNKLGLNKDQTLFVYCGSLGPQYGWKELIAIIEKYYAIKKNIKLLILTGSPDYAKKNLPPALKNITIIKTVPFSRVPDYLNAGDIAFAIREPKPSMIGVAPIKLGEYLLMGLPTIASKCIGDTEAILNNTPYCFLYDHIDPNRQENAISFIQSFTNGAKEDIRDIGIKYFSLEKSSESYINAINNLF